MFKRMASLLLAALMIAGIAPFSVFAHSESLTEDRASQTEVLDSGVSRETVVKEESKTEKREGTAAVSATRGAAISYIDENGDAKSVTSYTIITSSTTELSSDVTGGWYVLQGEFEGTLPRMSVTKGDVHIILADDAKVPSSKGITVTEGHTLYIYGQENNSGTMTITGDEYCAGIGGVKYTVAGTVVICGGTLNVTGGRSSAAIGNGYSNPGGSGAVRITGGIVNATGGQYSAGIGGGYRGEGNPNTFGLVEITGGKVYAKPGYEAAAIGGGCYGTCTTIKILGGQVTTERNGTPSIGYSFRASDTNCDIYISWTRLTDSLHLPNSGYVSFYGTLHVEKPMMNANTWDLIAVDSTSLPSGVNIVPPHLSGSGTKEDPYCIANVKGWDIFEVNLNDPDTWNHFEGKYVKFTGNVTTTKRVATTRANSFNGTILGNGKTLYFDNYGVEGMQDLAPFGYFDGNAEVQDLNLETNIHRAKGQFIAGLVAHCYGNVKISDCNVTGTLSTNSKNAAGFVAEVRGTVTIIGCKSSVTIESSVDGDGTHGGFVGGQANVVGSTINIYGCIFTGSFISTDLEHPTTCWGGFIGWRQRYGNVYNSIFAPADISTADPTGSENLARNGLQGLNRNVYVTGFETGHASQGQPWTYITAGKNVHIDYGTPVENGVYASGITAYEHGLLYNDGKTEVFYADNLVEQVFALTADERAGYLPDSYSADTTLLMHGTGDYYWLNMPYDNNVTISVAYAPDPAHFSVSDDGTEYTIHSDDGWNVFCDCLENDSYNGFLGKTVKLDADISASRMAGDSGHEFCGIFDGNGYSIEFNPTTDMKEDYAAPFHYVGSPVNTSAKPATIRNLYMKGNIYSSYIGTSGLVGVASGVVNITNCRINTGVHSSNKTTGNDAGLVGKQAGGTLTITGCIYDGSLWTFSDTTNYVCGGFVGFREDGIIRIYNSLFAPWECNFTAEDCATFVRGADSSTVVNNSYYTQAFTVAQGKLAHAIFAYYTVTIDFGNPKSNGVYSVSGITAYENVLYYKNRYYSGEGDAVALTITGSLTPSASQHVEYTAGAGTLTANGGNAYTLTMPNETVTIREALVTNTYTVLWMNGDEILKTDSVEHGATPAYDGDEPVKADDDQFTYTFAGWTPEIEAVTGDITYTAVFTATEIEIPIVWNKYDLNRDDEVDVGDVTALLNFLASMTGYDEFYDLDEDGEVTVADVTHLLNVLAGN